jgi:hypothetical protein
MLKMYYSETVASFNEGFSSKQAERSFLKMRTRIPALGNQRTTVSLGRIIVEKKTSKRLAAEDIVPALMDHIINESTKKKTVSHGLSPRHSFRSMHISLTGLRFSVTTNPSRRLTTVKIV